MRPFAFWLPYPSKYSWEGPCLIVQAFNNAIKEKDFNDITVSDIVETANVSRTTFYRYFKDKYDVMNYNYKLVLDASLDMKQISNYRDLYEQLFMLGSLKLRDIRGAFQSTGINSFERFIYTYSKETVIEITKLNRNGEGLTKEEALQLDVFCYGISFMYHKWIDGYYSISAREAADSLFAIMPETLKYLWFSRH